MRVSIHFACTTNGKLGMERMVRPSSLSVSVTFHKERIKAVFQLHFLLKGAFVICKKKPCDILVTLEPL